MHKVLKLGEEFFWTMFIIFIALIAGFAILNWLSNKFSDNFIGSAAYWTATHASDQYTA
jgi:hypothetical protein